MQNFIRYFLGQGLEKRRKGVLTSKIRVTFSVFCLLSLFTQISCTHKSINRPQSISPQEALGMLKNDFAQMVDVDRVPPAPSDKLAWIVFSMGATDSKTLEAKAVQWAEKGQKIYILQGTLTEWTEIQLPIKEGRFLKQ